MVNCIYVQIPLIRVKTSGDWIPGDRYVTTSTSWMTAHLLVNGQLYLGDGQTITTSTSGMTAHLVNDHDVKELEIHIVSHCVSNLVRIC